MKLIPLTKGLFAQVDDADYDHLMQWKWRCYGDAWTTYAQRTDRKGKPETIIMHRQILNVIGQPVIVDHIDRNGLNNQRANLRIVTPRENNINRKKQSNTSSKHRGVSWRNSAKRWIAVIRSAEGKSIYLGSFINEDDAGRAYDEAAKKHNGDFAQLNFPAPYSKTNN